MKKRYRRLMTNYEFARSGRGRRLAALFRTWLRRKRSDAWWKLNCERYAVLNELNTLLFDATFEYAIPEEADGKSAEELWIYIRDDWFNNSWFAGMLLTCTQPHRRIPVIQEALGGCDVAEWDIFEMEEEDDD